MGAVESIGGTHAIRSLPRSEPRRLSGMLGHLFDLVPDALILVDEEGRILHSNAQADTMFGYPEGLAGREVEDLLPHTAKERHREHRARYMASPRVRSMGEGAQALALAGRRRDGSVFPVEIALSPADSESRKQFLASIRDISESIRERQAVARARYDRLVARVGEVALVAKSESDIFASLPESIATALGIEAVIVLSFRPGLSGQQTASRVVAFPPGLAADASAEALGRVVFGASVRVFGDLDVQGPAELSARNWAAGFHSCAMVPLLEWSQPVGAIIALSAARHRFEHDAVHCLGSIANLVSAFLQRRQVEERLAHGQRLEALGQLTGGVAHDFNNLLTVISGNLQLMELEGTSGPDAVAQRESMQRAVEHGIALTSKLLTFARRQRLVPRVIGPKKLLADLADMLARTLGEKVRITVACDADAPAAFADPAQLESALLNLCFNARDAMPRGGDLRIIACDARVDGDAAVLELDPGRYLQISVEDTGSGMSQDVLSRAFEPFFTTKEDGKGNGLGLSMVYGFVRQSGGQVVATSRPGLGTRIDLYLPCAPAEVSDAAKPGASGSTPAGRGETVLVVEDEPAVRSIAIAFVRSLGYEVRSAADAESALRELETDPSIELMFADVALGPGLSGIELASMARARWPRLRVLLTSGHDAAAGDPAGTELLPKPYQRHDLAVALRRRFDAAGS